MSKIISNSIEIDFPFAPYPCQIDYMDKVTRALKEGSNALLESPTGTGKTLCLLCAALGWQKHMKQRVPNAHISLSYSNAPNPIKATNATPLLSKVPVIVYASRTHAQLAQVVSELRASGYTPRMSVLGSREQLCIHPTISKLKGGALNHACSKLSITRSCMYKNSLDSYLGGAEGIGNAPSPMLDIEQLNELGSSIRATLKIHWDNAVVIFDEAHNLESVATDASSFTISSTDVAAAISEMQQVLSSLRNSNQSNTDTMGSQKKNDEKDGNNIPNLDKSIRILQVLFKFEERLDGIGLQPIQTMGTNGKVLPGGWLMEVFEGCGITPDIAFMIVEEIFRCSSFLLDEINRSLEATDMRGSHTSGVSVEPKLTMIAKAIAKIFRGRNRVECLQAASFYKVFITDEVQVNSKISSNQNNWHESKNGATNKKRILNYWCFSTGFAVEDLKKLGIRSIILTSGTLSPMDSFREDLRIPFTIDLENPHVIKYKSIISSFFYDLIIRDKQIWVGIISQGPSGRELNSSFANREETKIKDELGRTILLICQTMTGARVSNSIVPIPTGPDLKGGVLIFFPSYGALDSLRKHWIETGLWTQLHGVMGHIVVESKGTSHVAAKDKFNSKKNGIFVSSALSNSSEHTTDSNDPTIAEFEAALKDSKGKCILLAVCRGKMSEGIDFKDSKGRVVIITGIPYAPHKDPWVVLKKEYLDHTARNNNIAGALMKNATHGTSLMRQGLSVQQQSLTGQTWYDQSAMRAVNQALGRVIRHKNDWGAVFFLDSRFQASNRINQLSKWVRPKVHKYNNVSNAISEFRSFISNAMDDPELSPAITKLEIRRSKPLSTDIVASTSTGPLSGGFNHRQVVVPAIAFGFPVSTDNKITDVTVREPSFVDPAFLSSQRGNDLSLRSSVKPQSESDELLMVLNASQNSFVDDSFGQVPIQVKRANLLEMLGSKDAKLKHEQISAVKSVSTIEIITPRFFNNVTHSSNLSINPGKTTHCESFKIKEPEEKKFETNSVPVSSETSNAQFLSSLIDELRQKLTADRLKSLAAELVKVAKLPTILEQPSALRNFASTAYNAMSPQMPRQQILQFLNRLARLIPNRHVGLYESTCRKLCQSEVSSLLGNTCDSKLLAGLDDTKIRENTYAPIFQQTQKKVTAENVPDVRSVATSNNSIPSNMSTNQASTLLNDFRTKKSTSGQISAAEGLENIYKRTISQISESSDSSQIVNANADLVQLNSTKKSRGMAILASALKSKSPAKQKLNSTVGSPATLFKSLEDLRGPDRGRGGIPETKRLVKCHICNDIVSSPYAAACGHISCINCWRSWTACNKSCPICRAPIAFDKLTKLVIE